MTAIMINVEYNRGITTKCFCTVVYDVEKVHPALMEVLNYIKSNGWTYINHTICIATIKDGGNNL